MRIVTLLLRVSLLRVFRICAVIHVLDTISIIVLILDITMDHLASTGAQERFAIVNASETAVSTSQFDDPAGHTSSCLVEAKGLVLCTCLLLFACSFLLYFTFLYNPLVVLIDVILLISLDIHVCY